MISECVAPGALADHGQRTGPARWCHRGGSPEIVQPAATELGFLWGFALPDWGDEADPLHLPQGTSRRQRRPASTGRQGPSMVMSGAASGGPPVTRTE
jgi:hypothetical protein